MRFKCIRTIKCFLCLCFGISVILQLKFTINNRQWNSITKANQSRNSSETTGNDVTNTLPVMSLPPIIRHGSTVYHVGFLKVHKAGSTTMQNLLFRFSIRHNLTILLPRGNSNYMLSRGMAMPLKKGNHYDTFACHTVYSSGVFGLLSKDSVRIAIIRDPLERAISAAYYYRDVFGNPSLRRIPSDKFVENLVSFPEKYDNAQFSYTKNAMGKDFGFQPGLKNQMAKINGHLEQLKKDFQIVMVMERFEESLVLVKRELGWSLQDILFIQANAHHHKATNLTDSQRARFRDTNFLDYALYDMFYPIFEAKIVAEGTEFQEEVTYYKSVLTSVKSFCNQPSGDALKVTQSLWSASFEVTRRDCQLMTKDEILFLKELRTRHIAMQR